MGRLSWLPQPGTKAPAVGYHSGSDELQGSPEPNPPSWPDTVKVLSKASGYEVVDRIYEEMASLDRGQFSTSRYALFFEASPRMHEVDVRVGFYTSVYGLGRHPSDTKIRSVTSTNETPHPELGSLQNFWRRLGPSRHFRVSLHESFWNASQERRELPNQLPSHIHLRWPGWHAVGGVTGCSFATSGGGRQPLPFVPEL